MITCDRDTMTREQYNRCEIEFIKSAANKITQRQKDEQVWDERVAEKDVVKQMLVILVDFLRSRKLVCYGGTAINNILPFDAQFYDFEKEIADYDFYSPDALKDADELAQIFANAGFLQVEAKAAVHFGTLKVFVDFLPIADITQIPKGLFENLRRNAVVRDGVYYAPPDFLRMNIYAELCMPKLNISRWEKIYKRFLTLNEHFPMETDGETGACQYDHDHVYKDDNGVDDVRDAKPREVVAAVGAAIEIARKLFVEMGLVFIGGYAVSELRDDGWGVNVNLTDLVDLQQNFIFIDVLCDDLKKTASLVKQELVRAFRGSVRGTKYATQIKLVPHKGYMDVMPSSIEIHLGSSRVAHLYEANHCYSYNILRDSKYKPATTINVASIDTMIYFFLLFHYLDKPYYNKKRLMCMAHFVMKLAQKHSLTERDGIFSRYTHQCYGHDHPPQVLMIAKKRKYKELAKNKNLAAFKFMYFRKSYHHRNEETRLRKKASRAITTRKPVRRTKRTRQKQQALPRKKRSSKASR